MSCREVAALAIALSLVGAAPALVHAQDEAPAGGAPDEEEPAEPRRQPVVRVPAEAASQDEPVVPPLKRLPIGPTFPFALQYGLELSTGVVDAATPLDHLGYALGATIDVGVTRWFHVGVRYGFLEAGDEGVDQDGDGADDDDTRNLNVHLLSAGPRFVLFSNEAEREGWFLDLDAGWGFLVHDLAPDGPFVRVSAGRQAGEWWAGGRTGLLAIGLSAIQGMGRASELQAVLATFTARAGIGVDVPPRFDAPREPAAFHYVLGVEGAVAAINMQDPLAGGPLAGIGARFGLPVHQLFEPRVKVDMLWLRGWGGHDGSTQYGGAAGLRVRLNRWLPLFVDGYFGYQFPFGTKPLDFPDGPFVETAFGMHPAGCGQGGDIALRYRHGLNAGPEGGRINALALVVAFEYGSLRGSTGEAPLERAVCPGHEGLLPGSEDAPVTPGEAEEAGLEVEPDPPRSP